MKTLRAALHRLLTPSEPDGYTPTPIAEPAREVNFNRFASLLPYTAYDPENRLFILEPGSTAKSEALGFCLEMRPQTGAIPEMADLMSTIFSYFPPGSSIQWSLLATPLIHQHLQNFVDTRVLPSSDQSPTEQEQRALCRNLAIRQARHFALGAHEPLVANTPYLLRNFRIVMNVTIPVTNLEDEASIRTVKQIRETCITTLQTYSQFLREWGPEDLVEWCSIILNPQETMLMGKEPTRGYDDGKELRAQMIYPNTAMRVTEGGMHYGTPAKNNEIVAHSMSVFRYPKACTLHVMGSMIGDYMQSSIGYICPFLITIGIVTQDFESGRQKAQMISARATQKAESPMARFMPELKDIKFDWDLAQKAYDEGKGTVRMMHQVILFSKPEDLARAQQAAQGVWRAKQFEIVDDSYMQVQGLLASLPMTITPSFQKDLATAQRLTTKTAMNAVNMAPLIAEWSGIGAPVIPMWGRRGQAMSIDLFANTSGGYNGCVVGGTGAGKSVLLNLIAIGYLGVGGRVWIIDIGRSYEKLCHVIGGQYIEFKTNANVRLNPFSLVIEDGDQEDFDDDMDMLVPLFAKMISPKEDLDQYRLEQLKMHILSCWYEKGRNTSIDDVAYSLLNNCELGGPNPQAKDPIWVAKVREMSREERNAYCDPRIRDMGVQLFSFTSAGPFGKFFAGEANINFNNKFIVLELEELAAKPELQTVIMFLLMHKITSEMYRAKREERKVCIIDEAWSLLDGGSGRFIETGYRRARKYGGGFLTGTQGVNDYFKSPAAEAALHNADWMFLMRQKEESIRALEKSDRLVMNDFMKKTLSSVKTVQGAYAEVFVQAGQMGSGIGRILLDPYTLLLFSSKAEDFEAVMFYRERGLSVHDAVEAVLADRGFPGFLNKHQRAA